MTAIVASDQTPFSGEIKVASRIVDFISSGLYRTPAACLKELINNSYDADASKVAVFVKPDADRIIIEDDGDGLTRDEFIRHFDRVSESHKRDASDKTRRGRPIIGKIGIGFIAANEICDTMELISTKRGVPELIHVTIDFADMRKDISQRRRHADDVAKGDYIGTVEPWPRREHFTRLFLTNVRGHARQILASARRQHGEGPAKSLYGRSLLSVREILTDPNLESWAEFDAYSETLLNVALNVPIQYLPEWVPTDVQPLVQQFEHAVAALDFKVEFDGAETRKPTVFKPAERHILEPFDFEGDQVAATGYLYAQRRNLKPHNLNGLLLRIRNAAVGEYDPTFWEFPPDEAPLFQSWASAEIWADDRLEDALNIDRRTLRVAHPAYVELKEAIHRSLSRFFARARKELYAEPAAERRENRVSTEVEKIESVLKDAKSNIDITTRRQVLRRWQTATRTRADSRALLRKFTVSELYDLVIDVANEVLPPDEAARFVQSLTTRLRGK